MPTPPIEIVKRRRESAGNQRGMAHTKKPAAIAEKGISGESEANQKRWTQCRAEVQRAGTLRPDWDGDGAEPPTPEVVNTALAILRVLRERGELPPSRISVSTNGTLLFVWNVAGSYTEVEISQEGIAWMGRLPNYAGYQQ